MIKSCQHGFTPYIDLGRIFRRKIFSRKASQGYIRGFTLIEVMVVIFIITVGLIGAFNVIQNITVQSRLVVSRLTAVYLAQEGVEMVRNQRDTNWIEDITPPPPPVSWDNDIPSTGSPGCSATSILGKFNRTCTVSSTVAKMDVSVGVSWQDRETWHSDTSTTELYNWLVP